jgi:arsenate reductase
MSEYTIYHNPRCSKSRQTLTILQENGVEPEVILYLETPPDASEIQSLVTRLGITPRELLRKGEEDYKNLGLKDTGLNDTELVTAMAKHPKLIERPIVTKGNKAVLGRPPENVLSLL